MTPQSNTLAWKIPWTEEPGGLYNPWGCWGSDTTERLHFHFSLSCNGEGNGNPLQCSCLENPRDGGAWWAAVYAVTQSRTRLKRLNSSSSSRVSRKQCGPLFQAEQIPLPEKHHSHLYTCYLCVHVWSLDWKGEKRDTEIVCVCTVSTHSQEIVSDKEESGEDKYHMILLICDILKNELIYKTETQLRKMVEE